MAYHRYIHETPSKYHNVIASSGTIALLLLLLMSQSDASHDVNVFYYFVRGVVSHFYIVVRVVDICTGRRQDVPTSIYQYIE